MSEESVQGLIRRQLRWLGGATIALYAVVLAVAGYTYWEARQNKIALCGIRVNTELAIVRSEQFLKDNPNGIPGIPPGLIKAGIAEDKVFVKVLSGLGC